MIPIWENRVLTVKTLSIKIKMCLVEHTLSSRPLKAVANQNIQKPLDFDYDQKLKVRNIANQPVVPWLKKSSSELPKQKLTWPGRDEPQRKQRSEWSRENEWNLKVHDIVWLVIDAVKHWEYKCGRTVDVFTVNESRTKSAIFKLIYGESNRPVVYLTTVFYDFDSEIINRAGDVGAPFKYQQEPRDMRK